MPSSLRAYRRRKQLAGACLILAGLLVLSAYLPPLADPLWMVRYIARELSLLAGLLSALAVALLAKAPSEETSPWRRRMRWLSAVVLVLGSLPLTATVPQRLRLGAWFSPWQYLSFSIPRPMPGQIAADRDVALAADRPELLVDVYRPRAETALRTAPPGAAIVVIHGGSFQRGDKGDLQEISVALSAAGYVLVDLRYRLAPQHPFPAAVQDILCIVGRLAEAPARQRYGIDPRRIAVLGRSAGGTLALSAAYAAAVQQSPTSTGLALPALRAGCAVVDVAPAAVIAIYPWTDLTAAYATPPRPDPLDTRKVLTAYLGGAPSQLAGPYQHASPIYYAASPAPLPPTLLIHGGADTMVPAHESARLAARLLSGGHAVTLQALAFAEHGFDHRAGGVAEQLARASILSFLGPVLSAR
jgi:acetyl esterase/lipase